MTDEELDALLGRMGAVRIRKNSPRARLLYGDDRVKLCPQPMTSMTEFVWFTRSRPLD